MDIPVNAEVFASDGLAGHSTAVIINPASRKVTHVIVKERSFAHLEHMLPIELVISATPDSINLRSTCADVAQLDPFNYSDYIDNDTTNELYAPSQYYSGPYMTPRPTFTAEDLALPRAYDHVPREELIVHKDGKVNASDGYVGRIDELLVNPNDGRITHLIVREGQFWSQHEVTIPVSEIDHMEDEHVYLKIDKHAVETLPSIPAHN